jgi:curved DNA-binding protein CbpA
MDFPWQNLHIFEMLRFRTTSFGGKDRPPSDSLPVTRRGCDVAGCAHLGEYRAPKSRESLREYYWFCLDHVREYNQKWDFFKGMTPGEIETHMQRSVTWDLPTWRMTQAGAIEEETRRKIYRHFSGGRIFGEFSFDSMEEEQRHGTEPPSPVRDALKTIGLDVGASWTHIKARYKTLAKTYHPDIAGNDATAEEHLKKINLAYSILKLSYQHTMSEHIEK